MTEPQPTNEPPEPTPSATELHPPEVVARRWEHIGERHAQPARMRDAVRAALKLYEEPPPNGHQPEPPPQTSSSLQKYGSAEIVRREGAVPMMTPEQAAPMLPASADDCEEALMVLHGILGIGPAYPPEPNAPEGSPAHSAWQRRVDGANDTFSVRIRETAEVLASAAEPWSVAALREASRALASSPELDDKIRYGRPITPADFERIRRGETHTEGTGEDVRVITTRTGFALKVARAKLYTFPEAKGLWESAGCPGVLSDARRPDGTLAVYGDAMFTPVEVEGQTWFRLR